jgi:hypothetical protein
MWSSTLGRAAHKYRSKNLFCIFSKFNIIFYRGVGGWHPARPWPGHASPLGAWLSSGCGSLTVPAQPVMRRPTKGVVRMRVWRRLHFTVDGGGGAHPRWLTVEAV